MKRQILVNKKLCINQKIGNIIFIGTDLPDLCHLDNIHAIEELKQNDLILGHQMMEDIGLLLSPKDYYLII